MGGESGLAARKIGDTARSGFSSHGALTLSYPSLAGVWLVVGKRGPRKTFQHWEFRVNSVLLAACVDIALEIMRKREGLFFLSFSTDDVHVVLCKGEAGTFPFMNFKRIKSSHAYGWDLRISISLVFPPGPSFFPHPSLMLRLWGFPLLLPSKSGVHS